MPLDDSPKLDTAAPVAASNAMMYASRFATWLMEGPAPPIRTVLLLNDPHAYILPLPATSAYTTSEDVPPKVCTPLEDRPKDVSGAPVVGSSARTKPSLPPTGLTATPDPPTCAPTLVNAPPKYRVVAVTASAFAMSLPVPPKI